MTLILALIIFIEILSYIIIADIVLSWISLVWLKFRPQFIADIIDPLYKNIKKIVTTNIWPFELAPILIMILLMLIKSYLISLTY